MSESGEFSAQMQRLKGALGMREDQDVAAALGLSKAALSLRKKRGAFPRDSLLELAARRPELLLNVVWILTGAKDWDEQAVRSRRAEVLKGAQVQPDLQGATLAGIEKEVAEGRAELKAYRDGQYAVIWRALDRMSSSSVHVVAQVAQGLAAADAHYDLSAPGYGVHGASTLYGPIANQRLLVDEAHRSEPLPAGEIDQVTQHLSKLTSNARFQVTATPNQTASVEAITKRQRGNKVLIVKAKDDIAAPAAKTARRSAKKTVKR